MANTKVSALTEMTAPLGTDELLVIDDPGGTPASQRASLETLLLATSDIIPATRVYNSGNLSIPNNTLTALTFDSERFDTDGIHSTVSNTTRLTCQTAGKYLLFASYQFVSNASGYRRGLFYLNGVTELADTTLPSVNGGGFANTVMTVYDLSVSDYVELAVVQTSGGSLNVVASANRSPEFGMIRIGD